MLSKLVNQFSHQSIFHRKIVNLQGVV